MRFALSYGLALPHLAMALGYAALLVLASTYAPLREAEGATSTAPLPQAGWTTSPAPLPQAGGVGGGPSPQTTAPDGTAEPTPCPSRLREGSSGIGRLVIALHGQLEAAGRMAFSNYLATSLLMSALCSGWGLGLFGQFGAAQRWTLVLLVWAMMLAWSQPWLARYRQGPLEWAWRSLTEWKWLALRR